MDVDQQAITLAVQKLRDGELVAFPTETVYGLGADARSESAVARVFARKGRPAHHPLIVHLGAAALVSSWTDHLDERLVALGAAFWPGPLTIVASRANTVPSVVTGGLDTVALRVPSHPVALALLDAFGDGIAAPSANRYGHVSPTTAGAVHSELGEDLFVLDAGPTTIGVESTIVSVEKGQVVVLRHGGVTTESLRDVVGEVRDESRGAARASGMMASHYAPSCKLVLCQTTSDLERWDFTEGERAVMGLAADLPSHGAATHFTMSSVEEYAQRLYASLRAADELGISELIVLLPSPEGLGAAVRDRLMRAATPRTQGGKEEGSL